jgi:hypothetical protein
MKFVELPQRTKCSYLSDSITMNFYRVLYTKSEFFVYISTSIIGHFLWSASEKWNWSMLISSVHIAFYSAILMSEWVMWQTCVRHLFANVRTTLFCAWLTRATMWTVTCYSLVWSAVIKEGTSQDYHFRLFQKITVRPDCYTGVSMCTVLVFR